MRWCLLGQRGIYVGQQFCIRNSVHLGVLQLLRRALQDGLGASLCSGAHTVNPRYTASNCYEGLNHSLRPRRLRFHRQVELRCYSQPQRQPRSSLLGYYYYWCSSCCGGCCSCCRYTSLVGCVVSKDFHCPQYCYLELPGPLLGRQPQRRVGAGVARGSCSRSEPWQSAPVTRGVHGERQKDRFD